MTISEVSKKYGLTPDALRYYERLGLIPGVRRSKSGFREYSEEDCRWIEFIKCMRGAGLPIEVLSEYVALFRQGDSTVEARRRLLVEQREQLLARIGEMQETLARLDFKISFYDEVLSVAEAGLK